MNLVYNWNGATMKKIFRNIKLTSLIFNILCIIFGICLIFFPETTKFTIILIFGLGLVVCGIIEIVNYFIYGYESLGFWIGCIDVLFGLIVAMSSNILTNIAIFAFVVGTLFIFASLNKMQKSFNYRRLGAKNWWLDTIFAFVILILGILIIANPFESERVFNIFLGVAIIFNSVMEIVASIIVTKRLKKIKHNIRDLVKKETIIDLDDDDYTIEK